MPLNFYSLGLEACAGPLLQVVLDVKPHETIIGVNGGLQTPPALDDLATHRK